MFGVYKNAFMELHVERILGDAIKITITKIIPDGVNITSWGLLKPSNDSTILQFNGFLQDSFDGLTTFEQSVRVLTRIGVEWKQEVKIEKTAKPKDK